MAQRENEKMATEAALMQAAGVSLFSKEGGQAFKGYLAKLTGK